MVTKLGTDSTNCCLGEHITRMEGNYCIVTSIHKARQVQTGLNGVERHTTRRQHTTHTQNVTRHRGRVSDKIEISINCIDTF